MGGRVAIVVVEVLGSDVSVTRSLREGPLRIGRAPGNDVMLSHPKVSSFHAVVAEVDGRVQITDLGSTNGSEVNGEPVARTVGLRTDDVIRLGGAVDLRVRVRSEEGGARLLVLEDRTAGVLHALDRGVVHVGSGHLTVGREGEALWCLTGGTRRVIEAGVPFEIGGHEVVVRPASAGHVSTARDEDLPFPYTVLAGLGITSAPFAVFERPDGEAHRIRSENRAALVYLLAKHRADANAARDGWCDDEALRVGIWGREAFQQLANNLNVIIRRTRKELDDSGFDGRCIEKIHGYTRLRVAEARLAS